MNLNIFATFLSRLAFLTFLKINDNFTVGDKKLLDVRFSRAVTDLSERF